MYQNIKCPNCQSSTKAILQENQWVRWIKAECFTCGWKKIIKDKDFDYIQPDSLFFKVIYGYDPITEEKIKNKKELLKKENQRQEREDNIYRSGLKSWQKEDIKSYVRRRNLE